MFCLRISARIDTGGHHDNLVSAGKLASVVAQEGVARHYGVCRRHHSFEAGLPLVASQSIRMLRAPGKDRIVEIIDQEPGRSPQSCQGRWPQPAALHDDSVSAVQT